MYKYKTLFDDAKLRLIHGGSGLFSVLALVLAGGNSAALGTSVEDLLPVLVHLQLDDANLGRVNTNIDRRAVGLLALNSLDVNDKLFAIDLNDLSDLLAFEVTAQDLDFIVLSDGNRPAIEVFLS